MSTNRIRRTTTFGSLAAGLITLGCLAALSRADEAAGRGRTAHDAEVDTYAGTLLRDGRDTFRYDTFGSEDFWGGKLRLHEAIAGAANGGVGPGLSPAAAAGLGLKIDAQVVPEAVQDALRRGEVNLNDPAVTLQLLKLDAVIGVKGFFGSDGRLRAVGIQCSLCHSAVDNAFRTAQLPAGIVGNRLDGWPARDLNVGAIIALSPTVKPFADLLGVSEDTVRTVLRSWGPGKFDAELIMDGKAFRPDGKPAATLIPAAFGLAGISQHTYTGWGGVSHWNALVANLEMQGKGTFWDPRLNNAEQFPIAARAGMADVRNTPDRITPKLAALHVYQLSLPAPRRERNPFEASVAPGEALFNGKAQCSRCHVPPIYTEPGWNMHTPAEIGIDDFQANRSPDRRYRTTPLRGMVARQKGGFYHDGRFATLSDVINHYDQQLHLALTEAEKRQLADFVGSL